LIIGSAGSGLLALCLLAGAVSGNHNGSGTIVLMGFGFVLLFMSVLVYIFGVVYLKSSKPGLENYH
jgi:hypothetical protein